MNFTSSLNLLRPLWRKVFKYDWIFGLFLILLFGVPRFIIVLNANATGNYGPIAFIFLFMVISPFVFLTKEGRAYIGIKAPQNYYWLFLSFLAGIAICTLIYFLGVFLFKNTISNWYVYISRSYHLNGVSLKNSQKLIYFWSFALIGMTFSPFGEELFYRGLIHGSFVEKFGEKNASLADSAAFALTHLAHFGIVYVAGNWQFLFIPATIWVLGMFITSRIFFICKNRTGSIFGAIISHAGFNFAMTYFIVFHIL